MKTLNEILAIASGKGLAFETLADQANWANGFRTAEKLRGDEMKNQIEEVLQWFKLAVPEPTDKTKAVQLGVHFEECAEMAHALNLKELTSDLDMVSIEYKSGMPYNACGEPDRLELLDSLCDQIVTAIGVAHMFDFDIVGALAEVNRSNFSKFVDGKPVFNEQGKISKPNSYSPPQLDKYL